MKSIYKTILVFALAIIFFTGCEQDEIQQVSNNGTVAVMPELSGMYAASPGNWTNNVRAVHPYLTKIINLPEGTTLRLIAKGSKTATQDYVVRTSDGGSQSLYPCKVDNNTGAIIDESKTPLYLSPGDYTFSAISPAHKYNNGITINNGESVIANNSHWDQTSPTKITIGKDDVSKVIPLNPLMQLTARMTFTLKGDIANGVSSLSVMQDGIEIDRIREESAKLTNVGDSIKAEIVANYNRIYIKEQDIKVQEDRSLRAEICLLPIDNRATPMTIIMNLMVNGVPTQFTYSIVNKILYAGYSYDYTVNVKIKDNISVANWQETSWSTEVSGE